MNEKANVALGVIAVILALIIFAIYLVNIAQRECNSNRDCSANAYCGSDFECHAYPQQIVVEENNFLTAAFVFGVALIIAAYIFKGGNIRLRKKKIT